nr:MAG: major capsid protein [Microviridae sp.]
MKLDTFNDSGSNYNFKDKMMAPNTRRSQFDLSYVNTFTADIGQIIPVWFSYYYPNEEFNVSLDNLIRCVNPPIVPLTSRHRAFFYLFKMDYSQMWTYWDAMMRKGWSGNFEAVIPTVSCPLAKDGDLNPLLARGSLADYLGFNFSDYTYQTGDEDIDVELPAMPFLAYQMIYRNYFLNKNIASSYAFSGDTPAHKAFKVFFPDTDYDLMIKGVAPTSLTLDGSATDTNEPLSALPLGKLRYRDFAMDYFTSALPWPMRGDIPVINPDITSGSSVQVGLALDTDMNDVRELHFSLGNISASNTAPQFGVSFRDDSAGINVNPAVSLDGTGFTTLAGGNNGNILFPVMYGSKVGQFPSPSPTQMSGTPVVNLDQLGFSIAISQPQLKLLWTNTLIAEKMARTDGTYGEFIRTFFGDSPRHWASHIPEYVGSTYQPIVFSEVLQTAPSAEGGTLGTVGAKGISSSSSSLGSFHASDYGVAMVLMSIVPDTYYSQGWMREHLYRTQDDFPLPERALLGMQPIYKGEIFYNPRDKTNAENGDLFAYQSRMDELRYRQNEVHGKVADPNALSFSPYVAQRRFTTAPALNLEFLSMEGNLDKSWLTSQVEVPFLVQVANRVTATRPLPYVAPPSAIMM